MYVKLHHDPLINKFYVICCVGEDKIRCRHTLTDNVRQMQFNINGKTIRRISSNEDYHLELGKSLNVPECCLVANSVMLEEANKRFKLLPERSRPPPLMNSALHFSPHLPCCLDCIATLRIGRVHERWIKQYLLDFAEKLVSESDEKPLYLN